MQSRRVVLFVLKIVDWYTTELKQFVFDHGFLDFVPYSA